MHVAHGLLCRLQYRENGTQWIRYSYRQQDGSDRNTYQLRDLNEFTSYEFRVVAYSVSEDGPRPGVPGPASSSVKPTCAGNRSVFVQKVSFDTPYLKENGLNQIFALEIPCISLGDRHENSINRCVLVP